MIVKISSLKESHPKFGPFYKSAIVSIGKLGLKRNVRKSYIVGSVLGALQAKNCGYDEVTLIEFGVASGGGLKSLMKIAKVISKQMSIKVNVIGFDNRTGLPEPKDFRDHPEIWKKSQFAMGINYELIDYEVKKNQHELIIGDVEDTLKKFKIKNGVLAFASIDVDYYSSTKPITEWLYSIESSCLLPASVLYFDDVINVWTYSDFAGESLAIKEFNDKCKTRKIELKSKKNKLYAFHDFENKFRTGIKEPKFPLELFVKDFEGYIF